MIDFSLVVTHLLLTGHTTKQMLLQLYVSQAQFYFVTMPCLHSGLDLGTKPM